ncbi:MAG: hypothetical protein J6Q15_00595 [Clostridia bacterium]|nr:hypothetical protein [Clostridia bacterium]
MLNKQYDMTNEEDISKHIFELHLNVIMREIKYCGGAISQQEAIREYNKRIQKEERQSKIYKLPLIGKMIYNNKIHNYATTSGMYKLILSLFDNFNFALVTRWHILGILQNIDSVYEKFYKDYYEMICGKNNGKEKENSL